MVIDKAANGVRMNKFAQSMISAQNSPQSYYLSQK